MPVPQQLFPEPAPTAASGNVAAGANAVADAAAAATANVNVNVNVNFNVGALAPAEVQGPSASREVVDLLTPPPRGARSKFVAARRCGQVKTAHLVRHATASQLSACEIGSANRDEQKGE